MIKSLITWAIILVPTLMWMLQLYNAWYRCNLNRSCHEFNEIISFNLHAKWMGISSFPLRLCEWWRKKNERKKNEKWHNFHSNPIVYWCSKRKPLHRISCDWSTFYDAEHLRYLTMNCAMAFILANAGFSLFFWKQTLCRRWILKPDSTVCHRHTCNNTWPTKPPKANTLILVCGPTKSPRIELYNPYLSCSQYEKAYQTFITLELCVRPLDVMPFFIDSKWIFCCSSFVVSWAISRSLGPQNFI